MARGERLTELLKQPQFSPLQVEEQVCVLYAGTRGYIDGIEVADVRKYEAELLTHLNGQQSDLLADIKSSKKLSDEAETKLKSVLEDFTKNFAA